MKRMNNHQYYLKNITRTHSDIVVLELADIKGRPVFNFKSGQYVMIAYRNQKGGMEQRHAFSIASGPTQGIKIGGKFTQGLLFLQPGDPISVAGPYGNFVFEPKKNLDLVMLAGGIGITPFLSAMQYATDAQLPNQLSLLYSNRTLEGTIFLNEIRQLEARNPNLRTLLSITEEKIPPQTPGIVNRRIDGQIIKDFTGGVQGKTFFICGPGRPRKICSVSAPTPSRSRWRLFL